MKKELKEISDQDCIEVAELMKSLEYGELDPLDVPEWLADVFGGNSCTQSDYVNGYQFMHLIDRLRHMGYEVKSMYELPNPYVPIVGAGKSAEGVEAILYRHTFDELEDDKYVFLRKGIFDASKEIAASYASQPIGKGAECSECAFPIVCSNPYCEKSLTPTTPTTDWDKVRKILDNRTHHNDDTEKTIQALKQHIGAGDSNTAYNDRIDSLVPNGWQQKLHDYIVNELSAIPLNNQLTDIRDIILPKRYPYTLTAPASEQVDEYKEQSGFDSLMTAFNETLTDKEREEMEIYKTMPFVNANPKSDHEK